MRIFAISERNKRRMLFFVNHNKRLNMGDVINSLLNGNPVVSMKFMNHKEWGNGEISDKLLVDIIHFACCEKLIDSDEEVEALKAEMEEFNYPISFENNEYDNSSDLCDAIYKSALYQ